jgi:hypothetical protein
VNGNVDIAFDCLPLRSVGRVDVPLDASPAFRARCEHLQRAIETHGAQHAYFLYNTRCVFRLANSDVENMVRFTFEGTLLTDEGDCRAERADLAVVLAAETCGGISPNVLAWFRGVVERAVMIEFNRFLSAGSPADSAGEPRQAQRLTGIADFTAMHV